MPIDSLSKYARASTGALGVQNIFAKDVSRRLLSHLDKSFWLEKIDQLDIDFSRFYRSQVERSYARWAFYCRIPSQDRKYFRDNIYEKLEYHVLSRASGLDAHTLDFVLRGKL